MRVGENQNSVLNGAGRIERIRVDEAFVVAVVDACPTDPFSPSRCVYEVVETPIGMAIEKSALIPS